MENSKITSLWEEYQSLLYSLAYQMMGSVSDAEDVVQDVFTRLTTHDLQYESNMKNFLCKLVANRCLDILKSASKKREIYVGPWLPEPVITEEDPSNQVLIKSDLSYALLHLLENLNPIERAIFILREVYVFDYPYIAGVVQKKEVTCRKILSRAKMKLENVEETTDRANHDTVVLSFIEAFQQADLNRLIRLLHDDVVYYADGGGKKVAALRPIIGKVNVFSLLDFLIKKKDSVHLSVGSVNQRKGLMIKEESNELSVMTFNIKGNQVDKIFYMVNPDKVRMSTLWASK
ncbi:RNA polymerase sigma factor SigJ [Bacillus carboniphilus]|uniref:RNA polymerase sigma factor SigJ n=1 Tax=Bacillus carboniphilus TaxID=86663 RepID=A0ABY9JSB6_9BACI|nr:RNA polymerase sigma factor SigJ [Bacillus carboniphilus]WLR41383.1 RNA polymerase sigma factor SigJ [Bacillus carboniphilus]